MKITRWKYICLVILFSVFIGGRIEKIQSAEPNVTIGERAIIFPTDHSIGLLSVRDWGSQIEDWTVLGEARGKVTVPAGKELRLKVPSDYSGDISSLADLEPSDLQLLVLDNPRIGDMHLVHLKGLTSLKLLNLSRRPVSGRKHPLLGKPLGDLKFTSIKGKDVDIAKYKDKVVLIDFWATWCGPCVRELPNVKKTYSKYHDNGFEIIGISLDRDRERLENFIQKNEMPWPQHFDGKGWKNEIAVRFEIHSIPSTFLLDKQGIIRHVNLRGSALDSAVAEVLGVPSMPIRQITDAGLAHLKNLTSLETLRLDNTQIGDEGLAHLAGLNSLKTLYLPGTQITDAGLARIGNLTALENLCVHSTKVTGAGLQHLQDLTGLRYLCVHNTPMTDEGLAHLKNKTALRTLYLHNTQVTDSGLEHLKSLTSLRKLNLNGTKVSDAGLTELKQALPDCGITGQFLTKSRGTPKPYKEPKPRSVKRPELRRHPEMPLLWQFLISAIAIPIICFITAALLMLATKITLGFYIPYWSAYKTTIIVAVVNFIINIPINVLGIPWPQFLGIVVGLFVQAVIFSLIIINPETNDSIGFPKGLLISLILLLMVFALACVFGLFFFMFMFVTKYAF